MPDADAEQHSTEVVVENLGGISETGIELEPGVTILTGRNATNRTSFLRAVMAALGSDAASVKADADEGRVELRVNGTSYARSLTRRNDTTVYEGGPYLDDPELAELFAFLLESNEARQAIERGAELYDVIMGPVDTADIDARIANLEAEREEIEAELQEIDELEARLPELEQRRTELESEVDDLVTELDKKREELGALETGAETPAALEDRFETLRERSRELEDRRNRIESERRVISALEEDRAELEADLDGLAAVDEDERAEIEATIKRHRESITDIEASLSELQSVIQFNESLVDGGRPAFLSSIQAGDKSPAASEITEQLLAENEAVVCWTCGSEVERAEIEHTVDLLREVHTEKIEERNELRDEIEELEAERKHLERTRDERRRLEAELAQVEDEFETRTAQLEELEAEAEELEERVTSLEAEIDDLETADHEELLALHREVNELEFERDQLEEELAEVEKEIGSVEERIEARDQLAEQRQELTDEITALRTRIERLEQEAVEQFNEQMEQILTRLEFDNLERIWLERVERSAQSARGREPEPSFDLHVVRADESGTVYEDTIDHLSESEREVVGLVFALSGYLAHEVYETVPFMLLDSLEALDAERISTLIEYLDEYAPNLIVALLPEDAAAVDESHQRVTEI